jgi:hypothetical protein
MATYAERVRNLRAVAASEARAALADARSQLETWDARTVAIDTDAQGEADWHRALTPAERQALARCGLVGGTQGPDVLASRIAPDATTDDAMARWMEVARTIVAAELVGARARNGRGTPLSRSPSLGGRGVAEFLSAPAEGLTASQVWDLSVADLSDWLAAQDEAAQWETAAPPEDVLEDDGPLEALDAITTAPDLMGLAEIAARCSAPLTTVSAWYRRGNLPRPLASLKCGPVWYGAEVERWLRSSATVGAKYLNRA